MNNLNKQSHVRLFATLIAATFAIGIFGQSSLTHEAYATPTVNYNVTGFGYNDIGYTNGTHFVVSGGPVYQEVSTTRAFDSTDGSTPNYSTGTSCTDNWTIFDLEPNGSFLPASIPSTSSGICYLSVTYFWIPSNISTSSDINTVYLWLPTHTQSETRNCKWVPTNYDGLNDAGSNATDLWNQFNNNTPYKSSDSNCHQSNITDQVNLNSLGNGNVKTDVLNSAGGRFNILEGFSSMTRDSSSHALSVSAYPSLKISYQAAKNHTSTTETLTPSTVTHGNSFTSTGRLTDTTFGGIGIPNRTISFITNGTGFNISSVTTNSTGYYSATGTAPTTTGHYSVQAKFTGDFEYTTVSSTKTLTVT